MKNSDNSIKSDLLVATLGVVGFFVVLVVANLLDKLFGLTEAFTLVDIASMVAKVFVASALSFLLLRIAFRHTLGRDLGATFDDGWKQLQPKNKTLTIIVVVLVFFASIMLSSASGRIPEKPTPTVSGLSLPVSVEGRDMIVGFEVGSKNYYNSKLARPSWPGYASGVTIGFGYDLGYNTPAQIRRDWASILSSSELDACISVAGKKGSAGKYALSGVKYRVRVGWDEAQTVFDASTLPRFTNTTKSAFVLTPSRLHPHCNSSLVSLVFNRGASMSGSRRREMKNIKTHIATGEAEKVPAEIRSMKRLWAGRGLNGLLRRRDQEAALFQRGMSVK